MIIVMVTLLALGSRWLIGGEDWNGFVESTAPRVLDRDEPVRLPPAPGPGELFRRSHRRSIAGRSFPLQRTAGHRDFLEQVRRLNRRRNFPQTRRVRRRGRFVPARPSHARQWPRGGLRRLCRIMREYTNVRDTRTADRSSAGRQSFATAQARVQIFLCS